MFNGSPTVYVATEHTRTTLANNFKFAHSREINSLLLPRTTPTEGTQLCFHEALTNTSFYLHLICILLEAAGDCDSELLVYDILIEQYKLWGVEYDLYKGVPFLRYCFVNDCFVPRCDDDTFLIVFKLNDTTIELNLFLLFFFKFALAF